MSMAQRSVSNTREVSRRVCGPVLELLAGLLSPINDTAVTTSTGPCLAWSTSAMFVCTVTS